MNDVLLIAMGIMVFSGVVLSHATEQAAPTLQNPMSVHYLEKHLRGEHPRLVFTPELVADLQTRVLTDPVLKNMYAAIRLNAEQIPRRCNWTGG